MARKQKRRVARHPRSRNRRTRNQPRARRSSRTQEDRTRELAAINRVRRGKSKTVSAAARAEGTSVALIKRRVPGALLPSTRGQRLRVRASDRYRQSVEILTDEGATVVTARGSRERELAGSHRAAIFGVLENKLPASALRRFRGKKVGGRKLSTNLERLFELARGGEPDKLGPLYVSPEANV